MPRGAQGQGLRAGAAVGRAGLRPRGQPEVRGNFRLMPPHLLKARVQAVRTYSKNEL